MKINSSLLAAALGLASASMASATQYIYYTGSTAARDCVYNTLIAGKGFDAVPAFVGYGSSTAGNCSFMEFSNTISGTPTIVKCHWSGSEAGVADVSSTTQTETFLADPGSSGVATSGASSSTPTAGMLVSHTVDVAQADNAKNYSKIPTSTAVQVADNLVIPFVFVKNHTTITHQDLFTNLTSDNFKALANGGDALLVFTGNASDTGTYVYLSGRDSLSGTRVNTFGDTGWGIFHAPSQIKLSGGNMVLDTTEPANNGTYYFGEGQSSGGTLASSMVDTTSSIDQIQTANTGSTVTGFIVVAYLGLGDEATALANGCTELTYNGVPYSQANVKNGLYAFWGNEYTLYKSGSASYITTFVTAMAQNLQNYTSNYEIPYSSMNVTRNGPLDFPLY